jgi:hypothetical protein
MRCAASSLGTREGGWDVPRRAAEILTPEPTAFYTGRLASDRDLVRSAPRERAASAITPHAVAERTQRSPAPRGSHSGLTLREVDFPALRDYARPSPAPLLAAVRHVLPLMTLSPSPDLPRNPAISTLPRSALPGRAANRSRSPRSVYVARFGSLASLAADARVRAAVGALIGLPR